MSQLRSPNGPPKLRNERKGVCTIQRWVYSADHFFRRHREAVFFQLLFFLRGRLRRSLATAKRKESHTLLIMWETIPLQCAMCAQGSFKRLQRVRRGERLTVHPIPPATIADRPFMCGATRTLAALATNTLTNHKRQCTNEDDIHTQTTVGVAKA